MILVARPADVAPSNVTSGTMTTTTISRTLGRRHSGEPRVVQRLSARRIAHRLRGSGLAGDVHALDGRSGRGTALGDDAHHRLPEKLQLLRAQSDLLRQLGLPALDHRLRLGAVGRQCAVEPRHVEHRLRILALTDGEVQLLLARRPALRSVLLVEVFRKRRREIRPLLFRQVDARLSIEAESDAAGDETAERDLLTQLVEVDVARLRDRAEEVEAAVPFLLPALPRTIAQVVVPVARLRHVRVEIDQAVLERDHRGGELERRSRRILALQRLVVERLARIVVAENRNTTAARRPRTGSDRCRASCRARAARRSAARSRRRRPASVSAKSWWMYSCRSRSMFV